MTNPDLGRVGVWAHAPAIPADTAREIEQLGYGALWLGASPAADLHVVDPLLAATRRLVVGTSIVNIWTAPAKEVAQSFHRLEAAYPGRFVLGIGAGHREIIGDYRKPYDALVAYLDELDGADVPRDRIALAALGPRVLGLARDRTRGALPYLVPTEHTRTAREVLGPDALLVVEHKAVLQAEPNAARAVARKRLGQYLGLSNYTANLRRTGLTDADLTPPGSDRFVDALAAHGTTEQVAAKLAAHLEAGADQVAVQVLAADNATLPTLRALAGRIAPQATS
jgi:probable F420-dependent oxidoreductase